MTAIELAAADPLGSRKARGAFFTPDPICRYIAEWACRTPDDTVLEPSCGEAAFLVAAGDRLAAMGAPVPAVAARLHGVEVHPPSAAAAREILRASGFDATITVGDFFDQPAEPRFDVVVGNPPYVRYQGWAGEPRAKSQRAALRAGVALTGLASSWAAFTVHAAGFLKPEGRLALVLPAELLTVNYASAVRRFLLERFRAVRLVLFEERVFPGVLEEVVLVLAEGRGPTDHADLVQVRRAEDLDGLARTAVRWRPDAAAGKWTGALLSGEAIAALETLTANGGMTPLETWGDTTLGAVTGNNKYFALSGQRVADLGLPYEELLRLSPPGSRHLRGLSLTDSAWRELIGKGAAGYLFRPGPQPSREASAYIAEGIRQGVPAAYKCRVREPWWRVPVSAPSDLFLTYMNADTARLTANRARVHHLNSVHGVYLRPGLRALGADLLPLGALNTATLLGAETEGRAYGGGMLKIEPREADRLPVPSPELLESVRRELSALRPQLARSLRSGKLLEAARLVDRIVLMKAVGLPRGHVRALEEAHAALVLRRVTRGRGVREQA